MRIDTAQIYKFYFGYEGTELMIPMAASNEDEAMKKLRDFMSGWIGELTPKSTLSPVQLTKEKVDIPIVDPVMLSMRIEEMVQKLIPIKKPKGANTIDKLVKDWTGFPYEPQNYASIIAELGRLNPNG